MLWPLLHYRIGLAEFTRRDLTGYLPVNEHFADEFSKLVLPDDLLWVPDYHFVHSERNFEGGGEEIADWSPEAKTEKARSLIARSLKTSALGQKQTFLMLIPGMSAFRPKPDLATR